MKIFILLSLLTPSCTLPPQTSSITQIINNEFYSTNISSEWKKHTYNDDPNCIYLQKSNKEKSILIICTNQETNPAFSAEKKSFFLIDGKWIRGGAMDYSVATLGELHGAPSIRGTASCGINTETNFHAAVGACTTIILFAEKYSISIETDGTDESNKAAEGIISSIKIKYPTKKTINELLPTEEGHTVEQ